jgi:hypothetical protein
MSRFLKAENDEILNVIRKRQNKNKDGTIMTNGMTAKAFRATIRDVQKLFFSKVLLEYDRMLKAIKAKEEIGAFVKKNGKLLFYSKIFAEKFVETFDSGKCDQVLFKTNTMMMLEDTTSVTANDTTFNNNNNNNTKLANDNSYLFGNQESDDKDANNCNYGKDNHRLNKESERVGDDKYCFNNRLGESTQSDKDNDSGSDKSNSNKQHGGGTQISNEDDNSYDSDCSNFQHSGGIDINKGDYNGYDSDCCNSLQSGGTEIGNEDDDSDEKESEKESENESDTILKDLQDMLYKSGNAICSNLENDNELSQQNIVKKKKWTDMLANLHLYLWGTSFECGNKVKIGYSKSSVKAHLDLIRRSNIIEIYLLIELKTLSLSDVQKIERKILQSLQKQNLCFQPRYYNYYKCSSRSEIFQRFSGDIKFPVTFTTRDEICQKLQGIDRLPAIEDIVYKEIEAYLKCDRKSLVNSNILKVTRFTDPELLLDEKQKMNMLAQKDEICCEEENVDSNFESWHSVHALAYDDEGCEETWTREQVVKVVKTFLNDEIEPIRRTLIIGIDHIANCSKLIIRIFATYPESLITIIERDKKKISALKKKLKIDLSHLYECIIQEKRLVFKHLCVIKSDFTENVLVDTFSHMFILSSGKCVI